MPEKKNIYISKLWKRDQWFLAGKVPSALCHFIPFNCIVKERKQLGYESIKIKKDK